MRRVHREHRVLRGGGPGQRARAAASNAPLALSIMAVELLGVGIFPHVAIVAVLACVLPGQRGLYSVQRMVALKSGQAVAEPTSLQAHRTERQ